MNEVNRFGFKLGDRFEATNEGNLDDITYSNGSIVELYDDDLSDVPRFKLIEGSVVDADRRYPHGLNFAEYSNLKKID